LFAKSMFHQSSITTGSAASAVALPKRNSPTVTKSARLIFYTCETCTFPIHLCVADHRPHDIDTNSPGWGRPAGTGFSGTTAMVKKPGTNPKGEFVFFDVVYEDGSQRSNRRVPAELLGGLEKDKPARGFIIEQDREIEGPPRLRWRLAPAHHVFGNRRLSYIEPKH